MEVFFYVLLLLGLPIALIIFAIKSFIRSGELKRKFQFEYNLNDKVAMGTLVAGHPGVNNRVTPTAIFGKGDKLEIFNFYNHFRIAQKKVAEIAKEKVSNITVEDQSTIEKRITGTRLLLTGVFAFAWKKKTKHELAYVTIYWNDGKFDHETIFEFAGLNAMNRANISRNKLIKLCNKV